MQPIFIQLALWSRHWTICTLQTTASSEISVRQSRGLGMTRKDSMRMELKDGASDWMLEFQLLSCEDRRLDQLEYVVRQDGDKRGLNAFLLILIRGTNIEG